LAHGLLAGGVQRNVYAAVIGPYNCVEVGVTLTTTGNVAGVCSRPQPAKTTIKRKARTDAVLTAGNLEIITLRMRLLFELQSVECYLDGLLSHP
jgi:hypothetical protein